MTDKSVHVRVRVLFGDKKVQIVPDGFFNTVHNEQKLSSADIKNVSMWCAVAESDKIVFFKEL